MIGIICFNSLRYAQFVYKYTDILDKNDIPYEVIYWNREGDSVGRGNNWIPYEKRINTFQAFHKKVFSFLGFTKFMYKTIHDKGYEKLIILTSQTAIPLFPLLIKTYKNKHIYDYRDITYENIGFYKWLVNKLVDSSYFTAISSRGFIESQYLDNHDDRFVISHNSRDITPVIIKKVPSEKVRIVYWGQVRQSEFNKRICDFFGNDDRFILTYHGAGFHEEIKAYVTERGYKNIELTGAYQLPDIEKFVKQTDVVLNMYENDKQQQPAMTVKFYDALKYGIPMLVTKDSYMSHIVLKHDIGFAVNLNNHESLNDVYNWYTNLKCKVSDRMSPVIAEIREDDALFTRKLIEFCKED